MGFYRDRILPWMIDKACGVPEFAAERAAIVPRASGRVLDIGIGTGLNIPFYDWSRVTSLAGIDPCAKSLSMAAEAARENGVEVELIEAGGEAIPLPDGSIDTVVLTYVLCTVPDVAGTLAEARRVLKPGGTLLYAEHVRAPERGIAKWQDRLRRPWAVVGGGCQLNRDTEAMIRRSGFDGDEMTLRKVPRMMPLVAWQARGSVTAAG
ncbi:MAG: class I SAM-dependent methyltransferase [Pacificimonas sp.]|jgi:ubiquinone/menaquinone biosynthesis C-methylase UbiE|nr:class I SAM-dependent methyltransferase [Pacificimonas sp.]